MHGTEKAYHFSGMGVLTHGLQYAEEWNTFIVYLAWTHKNPV